MRRTLLAAAFLACIPAANYLIGHVGTVCMPAGPCLIPVFPGVMAPSGVLLIGAALALRDALQEAAGRGMVLGCILAGATLSLGLSPALATASAAAFLLSELLDFAVYDRLRSRSLPWAVLASGLAGSLADSLLFSVLAFGSAKWAPGLILAKLYASAGFAAWLTVRRRSIPN
ncbi:VUT family protein [Roseomonas sp. KE2513]|uniref:VUT family protein n=1 Tax=Roseomonas sp. KE2513 TaxID=2479202 RepID=UPI0018DFCF5F|nr:VUT family protein [Roseomonas sp. KE2513]MBI0539477.1 VUT family protein [Roseomonas sp. KE2513]